MKKKDNFVQNLLGNKEYNKLIDQVLTKRLLTELYKNRKNFESVKDKISEKRKQITDEDRYIFSDFKCGKLTLNLEDKININSFYRYTISNSKANEIEKDFELCNFLSENEIRVAKPVYKIKNFTATEFIDGEEWIKVLKYEKDLASGNQSTKEKLNNIVEQIFKYHSLKIDNSKIKKILEQRNINKYYNIEKFIETINPESEEQVAKIIYLWNKEVSEPLSNENFGLIHNDLHNENVIIERRSNKPIIIDWGDSTFGPIHFDICRAMITGGYFNNPEADQQKEVLLKQFKEFFKKSNIYNYNLDSFYQSYQRAYASIRMRLVNSAYKLYHKIKDNEAYKAKLREGDLEFLKLMPSYQFSKSINALRNLKLEELIDSLNSASMHKDIKELNQNEIVNYIQEYNPDINGWKRMRQILENIGEVDKDTQKLNKYVNKRNMFRKLSQIALASTAALGLIFGSTFYFKEKEILKQQLNVVNYLADNINPELNKLLLVTVDNQNRGKLIKYVPNSTNYFYYDSSNEFKELYQKFKESNKISIENDIDSCVNNTELVSYCYNTKIVSETEYKKWKLDKIKELEQSEESCLENSIFKFEFDYFKGMNEEEVIKKSSEIVFKLPGLVQSIKDRLSQKEYNTLLDKIAKPIYNGTDNKFKVLLLVNYLANQTKNEGNIAYAYLNLFCNSDDFVRYNNKSNLFLSKEECAVKARDTYFTLSMKNGLNLINNNLSNTFDIKKQNIDLIKFKKSKLIVSDQEIEKLYQIQKENSFLILNVRKKYLHLMSYIDNVILKILKDRNTTELNCYWDYIQSGSKYNTHISCVNTLASLESSMNKIQEYIPEISEKILKNRDIYNAQVILPKRYKCNYKSVDLSYQVEKREFSEYTDNLMIGYPLFLDTEENKDPKAILECLNEKYILAEECKKTGMLDQEVLENFKEKIEEFIDSYDIFLNYHDKLIGEIEKNLKK